MKKAIPSFLGLYLCIYIILYIFPFPLDHLPGVQYYVLSHYDSLRDLATLWVGNHILKIGDLQRNINGSGDTAFHYVQMFTYLLTSFLLAVAIWILYHKNLRVQRILAAVIIYSRYYLGMILVSYGVSKFGEGQFPSPQLHSLEQLYGDFSPMGLAWRFFGYSDTYKIFMGLAEIIPGVLLLFRRTTPLGALLAVAVTTNIVLVNFSFDVPVKIFSSHLLFLSFVILTPFAVSIFRFLILNQSAQLRIAPFPKKNKTVKISRLLVKGYLVLFVVLTLGLKLFVSQKFIAFENQWEGVYTMDSSPTHVLDSANSNDNWSKVIIANKSFAAYNQINEPEYYQIKEIHEGGKLDVYKYGDEESLYTVEILEGPDSFTIKGHLGQKKYLMNGTRKGKSEYALMRRGFNWVNEYPFNR
jgi:uncharacterized membrane protein YphA (DoxX/SURF4 family)